MRFGVSGLLGRESEVPGAEKPYVFWELGPELGTSCIWERYAYVETCNGSVKGRPCAGVDGREDQSLLEDQSLSGGIAKAAGSSDGIIS